MKKVLFTIVLVLIGTTAFAAEGGGFASTKAWHMIALAIAGGLVALGQGKAAAAACEGIARNPGAGGAIRTTMIIALALMEALAIYVLISPFVGSFD